jgi:four helix bundle protein
VARPKSYEDLIVWQKAMAFARHTYQVSKGLPSGESYGLISQIRRAAVSVPSNIAEGYGRLTDTQFRDFLGNARGSLFELQTQLRLAGDLGYINQELVCDLVQESYEIARIANALISSLGRRRETNSANTAGAANSASQ